MMIIIIQVAVILIVLYLGYKAKWFYIVSLGVVYDLLAGGLMGINSLKFLGLGLAVYLIKEYWPIRHKKQLSLKFD